MELGLRSAKACLLKACFSFETHPARKRKKGEDPDVPILEIEPGGVEKGEGHSFSQ